MFIPFMFYALYFVCLFVCIYSEYKMMTIEMKKLCSFPEWIVIHVFRWFAIPHIDKGDS